MRKYKISYKNEDMTQEGNWYIKAKNECAAEQVFKKYMGENTEILEVEET